MEEVEKNFRNYLTNIGLAPNSIVRYMHHYKYFGGLQNFNQPYIDEFVKHNKFSTPTRAFLKNYITFIKRNHLIPPEIMTDIEIPKRVGRKEFKIIEPLTEQEILAMEKVMKYERDKLMLLISFYCGLRLSGILSLTPSSFNWKDWFGNKTKPLELKVKEKGDRERIIYVPPVVANRLFLWIKNIVIKRDTNPNNPLWKTLHSNGGVKQDYWDDVLKVAGRKALNKNIHSHLLRHGSAMWLLNKGWRIEEIQEHLGHSSISTTQIYIHTDKQKIKRKYDELYRDKTQDELSNSFNLAFKSD